MDKNKKDMKTAAKPLALSKKDPGKDMMTAPAPTDSKPGDKKYAAIKTGDKKTPATYLK